ncbi:MAG: triose-phosphate isomerase family protein [Patescibacteria group bacterium]
MKLLIANWKSHKNSQEVLDWLESFKKEEGRIKNKNNKIIIAPPMSLVGVVDWFSREHFDNSVREKINLGIQDISPYPMGKYTGAISIKNLEGLDVKYAIVGHSERRRYFHETHNDVANKVAQCIDAGITPVVCVDDEYVSSQAAAIKQEHLEKCIVAYEELSAIGSGKNEPIEHVQEVFSEIKKYFGETKLIYGGSVNASNVQDYLEICDGVLVGSASLKVEDFAAML